METEIKTPSLVYEVCFGAVFKIRHEGRQVLALSKRDQRGYWLPAQEISDEPGVYNDLGADQFAVVMVESKDDVVRLRDIFRAALTADGDTGTIAQAVKAKALGSILEKSFKSWLKEGGPILLHSTGEPSIIYPVDLVARYDYKQVPALRKAYAFESKEGVDSDRMPHIEKVIAKFNEFLDEMEPEDELYWFDNPAPLASRAGYVILRKGRAVAFHITIMS